MSYELPDHQIHLLQKANEVSKIPFIKEQKSDFDKYANLSNALAELQTVAHTSKTAPFESFLRCIKLLVHASQCHDANCPRISCYKMKRVVRHSQMCDMTKGTCPNCKRLHALCTYHAKYCKRERCNVPPCLKIRQIVAEGRRSEQRREAMLIRRRMEGVTTQTATGELLGPLVEHNN